MQQNVFQWFYMYEYMIQTNDAPFVPKKLFHDSLADSEVTLDNQVWATISESTDYGRPERKQQCPFTYGKQSSLHGRKFTPTPKFLGTAKVYCVCHIGPIFQISLIYAFIGCPQSVSERKSWKESEIFFAKLTIPDINPKKHIF